LLQCAASLAHHAAAEAARLMTEVPPLQALQ
jgi:hypothetical protein